MCIFECDQVRRDCRIGSRKVICQAATGFRDPAKVCQGSLQSDASCRYKGTLPMHARSVVVARSLWNVSKGKDIGNARWADPSFSKPRSSRLVCPSAVWLSIRDVKLGSIAATSGFWKQCLLGIGRELTRPQPPRFLSPEEIRGLIEEF